MLESELDELIVGSKQAWLKIRAWLRDNPPEHPEFKEYKAMMDRTSATIAALEELYESRWLKWPEFAPGKDGDYLVLTTYGDYVVVSFEGGMPDESRVSQRVISHWKYITPPKEAQ